MLDKTEPNGAGDQCVASKPGYSSGQLMRFLLPSLLGVLLFLTPVYIDGRLTILVAFAIDYINDVIKPLMVPVTVFIAVVPSFITVLVSCTSLKRIDNRFVQLFNPGRNWTIVRMVGAILMLMVFFKVGPEWVWHRNTGGVMLYDVGPVVLAIYFLSALLLPLVTDYGLMEFVGTYMAKVFEKVLKMPGRAAVDCLVSWLTASSMGIILSTQQYRKGFYTSREACVMATTYSTVSLAYSYLLLKLIGMEHVFIPWYLAVTITGIVCALIVPRLPPLSRKPDLYHPAVGKQVVDDSRPGESMFAMGVRRAVERAATAPSPLQQVKTGVHAGVDIAISVYPTMMVIGCCGLALVEFTSLFQTLSLPLVPYLELLRLPEADKAAPALLAGVVDSIMPSILGASIESEITRFVMVGVAVNQLIFFTEAAILMMRANIGLKLIDLIWLYLIRVMISLPVMALCAHLMLG